MPKVSDDYLQARRNEIIDAAAAAIARRGIQGATLGVIRDEAGVSSGALYHYFRSKEDIITALRDRSVEADEEIYEEAERQDEASEALVDLVGAGMTINHGSPGNVDARLAVMLWAEALTSEAVLASQMQLLGPWRQTATRLIERGTAEGAIADDVDLAALVEVLTALSFGATLLEAWEPGRIDPERLAATTGQLVRGEVWQPASPSDD